MTTLEKLCRAACEADLTFEIASELLWYDPDSGKLFWKERSMKFFSEKKYRDSWNSRLAGKEAMTGISHGYMHGTIIGRNFPAHRVCWLLHYGVWPTHNIDHIDGNPRNNAIRNLRDVPPNKNAKNLRLRSDNKTGAPGVSWSARTNRWIVKVKVDGRAIQLGSFATKEQAIICRFAANQSYGFTERHGRLEEG